MEALKDLAIGVARTVVPGWWAAVVAYVAGKGLLPGEAVDLANNAGAAIVLPAILAAVYAVAHIVEVWLGKVPAAVAGKWGAGLWAGLARAANVLLLGVPKPVPAPAPADAPADAPPPTEPSTAPPS